MTPLRTIGTSVILTDVAPILAPQLRVNGARAIPAPRPSLREPVERRVSCTCESVTMTDTCAATGAMISCPCSLTAAGAMAKGGFRSKASPSPDQSIPSLMSIWQTLLPMGERGFWFRRETEKAGLYCYGNSVRNCYGG